jgi:hypothetical protein
MPTFDDLKVVLEKAGEFIKYTWADFKAVWEFRPNVLIWCGIAFLIACFV